MFIRKLNDLALEYVRLPDKFKYAIAEELNYVAFDETESYTDVDMEEIDSMIWTDVIKEDFIHTLDALVGFYGQRSS